ADLAGIHQLLRPTGAVVVAEQLRTERHPGPLRLGPADHHELLARLALELQPVFRAAAGIRRVRTLGDQPLPATCADLPEVLLTGVPAVRCPADRVGPRQQGAQPPFAFGERLVAHVLAVDA